MTDTPPPETPPEAPSEPPASAASEADPYANLSPDELRATLVRSNAESAGRRHEVERLEAQIKKMERERESEQERVVREAVERAVSERDAQHANELSARDRIIAVKDIRVLAAEGFADPEDAVAQLAHAGVLDQLLDIEDPGKRQAQAKKALDELLAAKAYLARSNGRPQPLVSQGGRSEQPQRARERSWLRG